MGQPTAYFENTRHGRYFFLLFHQDIRYNVEESDVKGIISNYLQNRVFHRCPETQKRLRRQISDLYFLRVLTQTRNSLVLKQSRGHGFAFHLRQDILRPVINLDDHF